MMVSTHRVPNQESEGTMSMKVIEARFTDKPVKLDDAKERRVLTALKMIYEGGSLDGIEMREPGRYSEHVELMFDVMLCLPKSAWACVLAEVDKKIGTAALRKIILRACNESDPPMLKRLKRGVALLDRENKRKLRKTKAAPHRAKRG